MCRVYDQYHWSHGSLGNFTLSLSKAEGLLLLVHAYLPEDAALSFMWSPLNRNKTAQFLNEIPEDTHFLFMSYGCEWLLPFTNFPQYSLHRRMCKTMHVVLPQLYSCLQMIQRHRLTSLKDYNRS